MSKNAMTLLLQVAHKVVYILMCISATILSLKKAYALDFSGPGSSLADTFESFIDDCEGETTFRSLLIPTGGRVESLGTAFTGLADDIGFFEYNPAASAVLDQTEIALYHNSWIADSNIETLAATTRNDNLGMGIAFKCFYVPFSEYNFFGDRVASSYYSESTISANIAYNFLAGYNFKGIAVGANLKASYRSIPDYTDNDTNEIIKNSGLAQSGAALMADFGMLLQFNFAKPYHSRSPNVRIGVALTNVGAGITGFGDTIQLDDPLPTRISAGISYKPLNPVTLCAEVRRPFNLQAPGNTSSIAIAVGSEVQITTFLSALGGLLISGGNPRISLGSEFEVKKLTLNVNYTFDLSSSLNPVNHISLSAKFKLGDKGRSVIAEEVERLYLEGVVHYANNELDNAEQAWEKAARLAQLGLHQRYDPALEAIASVQARKDIRNTLDERERIRAQQTGTD